MFTRFYFSDITLDQCCQTIFLDMDILPVSPPEPVQANDGASVFSNRSTSAQPHQQVS